MSRWIGLVAGAVLLGLPTSVGAQTIEVSPFGGYRFGGDLFERVTGQPVDLDGAPVVGGVVNVAMYDGLWFEGLFTHQRASITIPGGAFVPPARWTITVDHYMAGGLQEFGYGRARPFLTGMLGLTHYAAEGDNEIRFVASAGGGVKLYPIRHLGVRLDGRVFATFADIDGRAVACTPGFCLVAFETDIIWQAEFTAGLVVAF
jgi:hypothetical protein